MAEGKGKWTSVFQTGGNRFIIRNERRADVASIPTKVEGAADYANLIITAVNTYPAVEGLVKALEATQFGFNHRRCPVCAGWNVGPNGETDMAHTKDCIVGSALSRFRSLQNGGAG